MDQALFFEQGPIRPPSEAGSLLIRVTRNCPWNKCSFCGTYTGEKFTRRSVDEVKADVETAGSIADRIREISWASGDGGSVSQQILSMVFRDASLPDSFRSVALWMASGAHTVFLQDANSLILSTDSLVQILDHIRGTFPSVKRITSYARAITLKGKSVRDYVRLKEAGLTRLHVGMESGSNRVLKTINKGSTAEQLIEGGKKVVQAGLSLCLYIMPGIGGMELSEEHATESARAINAINPDYVRFRSLFVRRRSDLFHLKAEGRFTPPGEDHMVAEIRRFIQDLDGVTTTIVSDHILNLLEEVEGTLPGDKRKMLDVIDAYLAMPDDDRLLFQLGRRGGALRSLNDFRQPGVRSRLEAARRQIEAENPGGLAQYVDSIKMRFI